MSEPIRIQIDRGKAVCPYCKGDLAGHVWLCPGCDATHHADCIKEHGRCATCGHATERAGRADDRLLKVRSALTKLGFAIVREGAEEVVAFNAAWNTGLFARVPFAVHVLRVASLPRARVEADLARLRVDPLAATDTLVLYVADVIERDAGACITSGDSAHRKPRDQATVAVAWAPDVRLVTSQAILVNVYASHANLAREIVERSFAAPQQPIVAPPAPIVAAPRAAPAVPEEPASPASIAIALVAAIVVGLVLLFIISGTR